MYYLYLPVTQLFRKLSPIGRVGQYNYYETNSLRDLSTSNKMIYILYCLFVRESRA